MKKIVFWIIILACLMVQAIFIYCLSQPEIIEFFTDTWNVFDVEQTHYSKFVFSTIQWWGLVPIVCLSLAIYVSIHPSKIVSIIAIVLSLIGVLALLLALYSPALLI